MSSVNLRLKNLASERVDISTLGVYLNVGAEVHESVPSSKYDDDPRVKAQLASMASAGLIEWELLTASEEVGALLMDLGVPATANTSLLHAAIYADDEEVEYTPVAQPDKPRNLVVLFPDTWDGGNVTVYGQDQFGGAVSETFPTGSNVTRTGTKVFSRVTKMLRALTGAAHVAATVGTGTKLGLPHKILNAKGFIVVAGVTELGTWDATLHAVTPTTPPNSSRSYFALANPLSTSR